MTGRECCGSSAMGVVGVGGCDGVVGGCAVIDVVSVSPGSVSVSYTHLTLPTKRIV